jgi:hypothetical protein
MREIKFRYRLRNKEDNQHIIVCVPLYSEQNGLMQFPIDLSVWEVLSIDEYIGIKDIKDKEIYTGDILKIDKGWTFALRTVLNVKGGFAIECLDSDYGAYGEKGIYVPIESLADEQSSGYIESCSEIVGNIYDNKDGVINE